MITAGILPACTAVWHRGVLELVRAGWWQDLPGADRWTPAVWLAIPAAVVTLLAIAAAALSGARALIVLVGLAGFVHPLLPLVLAPLALTVRTWPSRPALVPPAIFAAAVWAFAWWLTPSCVDPWRVPVAPLRLAAAWGATIGLAGGVLLALDALFSRLGRWSQLGAAVLLVIAGGVLVTGRATDAPALLGASGAVLWWRVAAGGSHVVAWQTTMPGRLGAMALVALVPVLAALPAVVPKDDPREPGTADIWAALEAAGSPSTIMTTGGRADIAATIWRSGPTGAQRSLTTIPPDPDATSRYLATSAVYAWSPIARRLSMRGMLVAPIQMRGADGPLLWRVLQFERCEPLTSAWTDISAAAFGGQFAGVFPEAAPNRGALVYVGSSRQLLPQPLDWPAFAMSGFERQTYDRDSALERAALGDMAARDGFDQASLGESRYVTRVRFDRRNMAPDTLAVSLGGVAAAAWARLYSEGDARADRQPLLCRSSVGQPVTAYAGAPRVLDIDVTSPYAVGGGWHGAEQVGESRFRWTEGAADVVFVAQRAQPLVLRLDAQPGTGNWSSAALRVTLNGTDVRCRTGTPPCDWLLPAESMRTGLNVITLHSATVPAPPPDPRRLGLMVRAATLERRE
jgi:hypothetical protein